MKRNKKLVPPGSACCNLTARTQRFECNEILQVNQQLIQRVFRLRTAVSRLKAEVAKLGGGQDTVEHRKNVSESISKIQDEAQDIKQQLMQVAPEQKNRQTAKILSDFEVSTAYRY